jgi:hypothetical protein
VKNQNLSTYAFTFYEAKNLNNSGHTLSIVLSAYGNGNSSGFHAFDYADIDGITKSNSTSNGTGDSTSNSGQVFYFTSLGDLYLPD